MVLEAVKYMEKSVLLKDVEDVNILGLDQGCILLYTGTTLSRSSSILRTIIGGIQLNDEDHKIYYRHSSCVKVTHASINAARSLCCFVTRSESHIYDVFVVEIGLSNGGRLFSLKISHSSSIRAYFASYDVILLLYRDAINLFRMPNSASALDKPVAVDRDGQISECIYYQWDTLQQRLHIIEKRYPIQKTAVASNGFDQLVYTAIVINARGQFDKIMKIDFDFKIPDSSSTDSSYEILSNDAGLFLCWQLTITENATKVEYAVISLGHGRSLYISKPLNPAHSQLFQSRRVHFGLLHGDYVFAVLRGEFVHLLNFNIHLNFHNHIFLPDETNSLPYDTKYTTQRGLAKASTLLYEKRNLATYTIQINPNELIATISPLNLESIIAYGLVAAKKESILMQILEKILYSMYDELKTKAYIKEILTVLIFIRLLKRIHHEKYLLVFPATTVTRHHTDDNEVSIRSYGHPRDHIPTYLCLINIDKDYYEKLRSSFELSRKYRHKLPYFHQILTNTEDTIITSTSTLTLMSERGSPKTGRFKLEKKQSTLPTRDRDSVNENPKYMILLDPINKNLFNSVSQEIQQLHPNWEQGRIKDLAFEYVQATQDQCDCLIKLFTHIGHFDRTQSLVDVVNSSSSETYESLLVVLEKLYLAMDELGFSPTEELKRTLLQISYFVMPFDRFVTAIEQNILSLTEEFVTRIILEFDDDPKSYCMKEQLILMLPNTDLDAHSRLFGLMKSDRAKRMTAQLLVTRKLLTENKNKTSSTSERAALNEIQADEIMNMNSDSGTSNSHSRLAEQAVVTFLRDCSQRGILDDDEMKLVKSGASALASSAS